MKNNLIVAIGDSFTYGVGAYTSKDWEKHIGNPFFNMAGDFYQDQQENNNWATQLVKNHLTDYDVVNFSIAGIGNRAASKELYFNEIPETSGNVIVIFMLSGPERFDFLKQKVNHETDKKWITIWPNPTLHKGTPLQMVEEWYFESGYSHSSAWLETALAIADAENFCSSRGYKFMFTNAFHSIAINNADTQPLPGHNIGWNNFLRKNFTDSFLEKEGQHNLWKFSNNLKVPSKYITPCGHWTIEGQRCVAEEIFQFVKEKGYDE